MTWTYSNNPTSSTRDEVRFLVGDTDSSNQRVTDEEIAYALASEPTARAAAAHVAEALAAKYASRVDKSVGDLSISYSQQSKGYAELAKRLRASANISSPRLYAGGISEADKAVDDGDADRPTPSFRRGMMDAPEGTVNNDE